MMRKKKIIEQNIELFKQVDFLSKRVKELEEKLKESTKEIESLKANEHKEPEIALPEDNMTPIEEIKEKVKAAAVFNSEDYGAKAIGRIVVAAAEITSDTTGESYDIETVNRILGRAEVAKSEILSAVSDNTEEKEKRLAIDKIVEKTCDYFKSVIN